MLITCLSRVATCSALAFLLFNQCASVEASLLANFWGNLFVDQVPLAGNTLAKGPEVGARRVAIIGAGAAGSSTAYHLGRFYRTSADKDNSVEIVAYDKNPYVGGRSTTVYAHNNSSFPVELGASIFVSVNEILVNATREFNLEISSRGIGEPALDPEADPVGVFDGQKLRFTLPESDWKAKAKVLWRYGPLAPYRTAQLTKQVVGRFLNLYQAPHFPFASLSEAAHDLDLLSASGVTGEQFLESNGIRGGFVTELIQSSTRVNYGQNLGLIHGLETMICMAIEGAVSVKGGNWRIFSGMLNDSRADIRLNTEVTHITKTESGDWAVTSRSAFDGSTKIDRFHSVVIAGPYQFSGITIDPPLEKEPDAVPYVTLHVTLFTSRLRLSPTYFGLSPDSVVPRVILTTLNDTEQTNQTVRQGTGRTAVGGVGFFSVGLLRQLTRPAPVESGESSVEYLYKVFSPEHFSNERIYSILGARKGDDLVDEPISWIHRHVWKSYPYEYPRVTFEEPKLADNLWYTGGMDSFISAMESNSLMGMNVARLIVDGWEKTETMMGSEL